MIRASDERVEFTFHRGFVHIKIPVTIMAGVLLRRFLPPTGEVVSLPADMLLEVEELTSRQREVLECIRQNLTDKEIAAKLRISHSTAKRHVSTLLHIFGKQTRTELLLMGRDLVSRATAAD